MLPGYVPSIRDFNSKKEKIMQLQANPHRLVSHYSATLHPPFLRSETESLRMLRASIFSVKRSPCKTPGRAPNDEHLTHYYYYYYYCRRRRRRHSQARGVAHAVEHTEKQV